MKKLNVHDLSRRNRWPGLDVQSTQEVTPATGIVGQPRAVEALKFGLSIDYDGYNIFVTGLSGTGRMTTLQSLLDEYSAGKPVPPDICFLHNFNDPIQPVVLMLPAGTGKRFGQALRQVVKNMKERIPGLFEDTGYKAATKQIVGEMREQENAALVAFEKAAAAKGFKLVTEQSGDQLHADVLPVFDGKAVSLEDLRSLAAEGKIREKKLKTMLQTRDALMEEFNRLLLDLEKAKNGIHERLEAYNRKLVMPVVEGCLDRVREVAGEAVQPWLEQVTAYISEHLYPFLEILNSDAPAEDLLPELSVNVVVDNSQCKGAPVVMERTPSARNLFGTIDSATDTKGNRIATFREVRTGSLMQANGGYLVVNATDLFQAGGDVWSKLKRTLKNRMLQVERETEDLLHPITLKPSPVPIRVKVIILGDEGLYYLLYSRDDEFKKIFKVLSEFSGYIPITEANVRDYLAVIRKICDEEGLLPFSRSALDALLSESVRMTEDREKLTARFHLLADVMRESSFHATRRGKDQVDAEDVTAAIQTRAERFNLMEERSHELLREGTILIDTAGERVGQVNGLAVHDYEFHAFGTPSRITARVSLGTEGIVNIEREAELSGHIHDKGVLILAGYLRGRYGRDVPLSIQASICFEQSYGGVDGDSASSTELYALLSAIGNLPVRQDLAVTGSVNQYGEIQAVGGVNHKIEGFFRVCENRGLTGTQGVLIPSANVRHLNLRQPVLDAIQNGRFHIYAIDTVDEGISLLTGMPAGDIHQEGTVHHRVFAALSDFAGRMKEFHN